MRKLTALLAVCFSIALSFLGQSNAFAQYCTPYFNYGVHEITNVTLQNLNNSSTTGNYYENNTSATIPALDQGGNYSISITNANCCGLRSVWIDFNDNGTFSTSEWVVQNQYTNTTTASHNMTIPSNATLGQHRMRIVHNYNYWYYTADNPCPNGYPVYMYGQVEDYTVNIVVPTLPDCANLIAPSNAASVCYSSVNLSWAAASTGGSPSGYKLYAGTDYPPTNLYNNYDVSNATSFALNYLSQNTTYYWYVVPYNSIGSPTNCTIYSFNTNGPCYCTNISFNYGVYDISNVTLGTLNNSTTSSSFYEDNTSVAAPDLEQGIGYPMTVSSNNSCMSMTVWMDADNDGSFSSTEIIGSVNYNCSNPQSFIATIPSSAPIGQHRMRIVSNYAYYQWISDNPCPNGYPYAYGQVEDYTVNVVAPQPVVCGTLNSPVNNASNLCASSVTLSWNAPTSGGNVGGYYLYLGTDNPPSNISNGIDLGNITSYSPSNVPAYSTVYWSIVPYNALGPAASYCTIYSFSTSLCYCTPTFAYGVYDITNVTLGSLNSSTTTGNYYEDKTSTVTAPNLETGSNYTISITSSSSCMSQTVWIDFDDNGSFATNEVIGSINYTCNNTNQFTVSIPSNANLGSHRMRIVSNYAYWQWGSDNPCPSGYPYAYGQVEDYSVNITAPALPDCAVLNGPINNASTCYSSMSLGWSQASTGGNPTGYNLYVGTDYPPTNLYNGMNVGNVTSYALSSLSQNTTYYWYVIPYNNLGNPSNCSIESFVTNGVCYCTSIAFSYGVYEINNVSLGTLNYSNSSGSYYEDNTGAPAPDLEQGYSYSMSVSTSSSCMDMTVWIDYDDDGTFSNSEVAGGSHYNCSNPSYISMSISSSAPTGIHRMRIVSNYAYWQWISDNPCPNGYPYAYGQVEDYNVNIVPPLPAECGTLNTPANNTTNVCNGSTTLTWSAPTSGGNIVGYYVYVGTDNPPTDLYNGYDAGNTTSFNPAGLQANTTYYWSIVPYNALGPATGCTVFSFTTGALCYCTNISFNYGVFEITNVTLGSLNYSNSSGSYYENNTSVTAPVLEIGSPYTMSVNHNNSCMSTTAWIDINDDGAFSPSEIIGSLNYYCNYYANTFTATIPLTTTPGQHRMRVVSNYAYFIWGSDNPCPNGYPYAYGQVEDYTVDCQLPSPPSCTTTTSPANNATNICASATLSWNIPTSGGNPAGYYLYLGTDYPPTNVYNGYDVGNVTSFAPTGVPAGQTLYWSIVPYNAAGIASGCAIESYNTVVCYCTPTFSYGVYEITNVTLGSLNSSTTTGNYYEDKTSTVTAPNLETGSNYTISITSSSSCMSQTVWIDFDDNGSFASNEVIGSINYNCSNPNQFTVSIPSNASLGTHRMRVVSNYAYWQWISDNPCPSGYPYAYGQVEDYNVNIIAPALPDCATLNGPINNASTCYSSMSLGWSQATTGGNPTGYYVYVGTDYPPTNLYNGYNAGNVTNFSLSSLSQNTTYYWYVIPYNNLGNASNCSIQSFITNGVCYCTSINFSYGVYEITNVKVGTLNYSRTSGSYYEDNTGAPVPDLEQGYTYTLNVSSSQSCMDQTVWIDFNDDGTFSNSEIAGGNHYNCSNPTSISLSISSSANLGVHRMRIVSNYAFWQWISDNSCPNGYPYAYGQVEDYNINIVSPQPAACGTLNAPANNATNVCNGSTTFTWNAPTSGGNIVGYYVYAGTDNPPTNLYNGYDAGNTTSFSPAGLQANTTYYWSIVPYNALGPATGCTVYSFATGALCYCTNISYTNGVYPITNVTVGSLNNTTSGYNYYEDNTSVSAPTLEIGSSYSMSVTHNYNSCMSNTVWIDINDDGAFSASEIIGGLNYSCNYYTNTFTVTIPLTTTPGQHRMRIVANYAYYIWGSDNPCPNGYPYAYGQVEDYTVDCQLPAPPDCTTSISPANNASNICTSATLSWNVPTTGGNPAGYYLYLGTDYPPTNIYNGYNVGNTTSFAPSGVPAGSTIYWSIVPYNAMGSASGCAIESYNTVACYCTPTFAYGVYEITNVQLGSLNSSTTTGNYYEDKTSSVTAPNLDQGASYTMSISTSNAYGFHSVWIDFDDNGAFDNSTEWVIQTQYTSSNTASYNLNIPSNAPLGTHRMRVLFNYYYWYWYADDPCPTGYPYYMYGQVEDYNINVITPAIPDCAIYNGPINNASTCYSGTSLGWSPNTTGGTPTGYYLYVGTDYPPTNLYNGYNVGNVTTYMLNSLSQNTQYYWYVIPYNNLGNASNCSIESFTTNGVCYCTSISYNYGVYEITNVTLGTLNYSHTTGSYYEDNTGAPAPDLEQGYTYTMNVSSSSSCMDQTVWIDYDNDGTFSNSEIAGGFHYNCSNPSSISLTIPSNATQGIHRMRIVSNYAYYQWISDNPCPNGYPYAYGQVEDYNVNIVPPQPAACGTLATPTNNSSNVCNGALTLTWNAPTSGGNIVGYYVYLGTDNPPTNLYNGYDVGNTTAFSPTGVQANTTYYWSIVPYNSLGPATGCTVYSFTTGATCYCTNISYVNGVYPITNVTVGSLNNTTSGYNYYEDNTSVSAPVLEIGSAYSMSVTHNYNPCMSNTVWIDINDDGAFAPSEIVGSINYSCNYYTNTFTVTIPLNTTPGQHRMRIVANYAYYIWGSDNPCPNGYPYAYGQVEDYTVDCQLPAPPNCSTLSSPPNNATGVCTSGANLVWNVPTTGGNPAGYYLYLGTDYPPTNVYNGYDVGNVTSFLPSNIPADTTIYWYIIPYNAAGNASGCTINSFQTIPCYCYPVFNFGAMEISNVTLHTLNYSSTTGSYYEYNASVADPLLEQGSTYTISISSPNCCMAQSVWIDFDDNGTFNNTDEWVVQNQYMNNSPGTYSLTIPATAALGIHRMRVLQNYYYWQQIADNPCPNGYPYAYGQVEDYDLEVTSPQPVNCAQQNLPLDGDTAVCGGTFALTWSVPTTGGNPVGYYLYFGTDYPPSNMYNGYDMGNVTSFIPSGVQAGVTYYWSIVPYNAFGPASNCAIRSFEIIPCYCTPTWSNTTSSSYYISSVSLNTISHSSSGNNVYEDFTSYSTCLSAGNTYTLSVSKGYPYGLLSMWIDMNDNYTFDSNEQLVANQYDNGNSNVSYSVYIPTTSLSGPHRMRVLNNYYYSSFTANNPCGGGFPAYYYGQAEDYMVDIIGVLSAGNDTTVCVGSTWAMDATTSTCATGTWTVQSGNVSVVNATDPQSVIVVNAPGTNVLRWTIGTVYDEITITGTQLNNATITGDNTACTSGNQVTLVGYPSGGSFSGPGMNGNIFDPAQVSPNASYDISYMYTNSSGCSDTVIHSIYVSDGTIVSFPHSDDISNISCWSINQISGNTNWEWSNSQLNTGLTPNSGGMFVFHNTSSSDVSRLVSPTFDLSSITNPVLQFYWSKDNTNSTLSDSIKVLLSTDGGITYSDIRHAGRVHNTYTFWQLNSIMLSGYGGQSNVRIAFETMSQGSSTDMGIDQVNVFESDCPEATGMAVSLYNNKATFTWNTQPGVDYSIRYSTTPNGPWTYVSYATSPYTTPTLQPSTIYYWQVRATCNSSISYGWSTAIQSFTTTNPPQNCVRPYGVSNTYISNTARTVAWSNVVTADSFIVQYWYRTSTNSPWVGPYWKSVVASNTTNLTNLISGTDYRWRVKSMCLFQGSGYSVWNYFNSSVIRSAGFSGPEELPMDVVVYPNPNSGAFTVAIEIGKLEEINLKLTDMLGHTLYNKDHLIFSGKNLIDLDFGTLPKGVYILKARDTEDEQFIRITLQ